MREREKFAEERSEVCERGGRPWLEGGGRVSRGVGSMEGNGEWEEEKALTGRDRRG